MDLKKLVKKYGQDSRRIETYNVDLIYNQSQPSTVVFQPPPLQAIINNIPTNQVPTNFNFYVPPPPLSETNLQDDESSYSKRQPNHSQVSEEERKKRLERLQVNNPHLKDLMQKLSTPEDIQKWREERRAKFPTKERVQQKEKEIQDQIDRGEIPPPKRRSRGFSSRDDRTSKKHKYQHLAKQRSTNTPNNISTNTSTATTTTNENTTDNTEQPEQDKKPQPKKQKRQHVVKRKPTLFEQVLNVTLESLTLQLIQKDMDKAMVLQCLRYIVQQNFFGQDQPKT